MSNVFKIATIFLPNLRVESSPEKVPGSSFGFAPSAHCWAHSGRHWKAVSEGLSRAVSIHVPYFPSLLCRSLRYCRAGRLYCSKTQAGTGQDSSRVTRCLQLLECHIPPIHDSQDQHQALLCGLPTSFLMAQKHVPVTVPVAASSFGTCHDFPGGP